MNILLCKKISIDINSRCSLSSPTVFMPLKGGIGLSRLSICLSVHSYNFVAIFVILVKLGRIVKCD